MSSLAWRGQWDADPETALKLSNALGWFWEFEGLSS